MNLRGRGTWEVLEEGGCYNYILIKNKIKFKIKKSFRLWKIHKKMLCRFSIRIGIQ